MSLGLCKRSRSKKMHLYRWLRINVDTNQSTCFRWKFWECSMKILWHTTVIYTYVWPWNNFPCSDFCKLCNNLSNFSWIPTDSQKVKQSECSFRHGEVRPLSPLSVSLIKRSSCRTSLQIVPHWFCCLLHTACIWEHKLVRLAKSDQEIVPGSTRHFLKSNCCKSK